MARLGHQAAKRKRPLVLFLMDQKKTAGVGNTIKLNSCQHVANFFVSTCCITGNYILAEVLYRARLHPNANCANITDELWKELYVQIINVIESSYLSQSPLIKDGSIDRSFEFQVYSKKFTPTGKHTTSSVLTQY